MICLKIPKLENKQSVYRFPYYLNVGVKRSAGDFLIQCAAGRPFGQMSPKNFVS